MTRALRSAITLLLIPALLASAAASDVRRGNVRKKGTCELPPYDCLYTQSGWHALQHGWQTFQEAQWSDGTSSAYFCYPLGFSCDGTVRSVYVGGGFGYYDDTVPPETATLEFYRAAADPQYREVSGCSFPDPKRLVARYTFPVNEIWPTRWSDVQYCRCGEGEIGYYDDFEKVELTLDPPLEVDGDCTYFVSFYSNGDQSTGFWLTYGMMSGANWITLSHDAGRSFEPYGGW